MIFNEGANATMAMDVGNLPYGFCTLPDVSSWIVLYTKVAKDIRRIVVLWFDTADMKRW